MKKIEIRQVANGFWTVVDFDSYRGEHVTGEKVNVFETFDSLVVFLKEQFVET